MAVRLGVVSAERSELNNSGNSGCPDIFQLLMADDVDIEGTPGMRREPVYAVIGVLATEELLRHVHLPEDANIGAGEALVFVPSEVLRDAARELLEAEGVIPGVLTRELTSAEYEQTATVLGAA